MVFYNCLQPERLPIDLAAYEIIINSHLYLYFVALISHSFNVNTFIFGEKVTLDWYCNDACNFPLSTIWSDTLDVDCNFEHVFPPVDFDRVLLFPVQ